MNAHQYRHHMETSRRPPLGLAGDVPCRILSAAFLLPTGTLQHWQRQSKEKMALNLLVFSVLLPLPHELSYSKKNRLDRICHEFPTHFSCGHSLCSISSNLFFSSSIINLMSGKILLPSEGVGVFLPPMAPKLDLPFWS